MLHILYIKQYYKKHQKFIVFNKNNRSLKHVSKLKYIKGEQLFQFLLISIPEIHITCAVQKKRGPTSSKSYILHNLFSS